MTVGPAIDPTPGAEPGDDPSSELADHRDMVDDQPLLGVPVSAFVTPTALRGLGLLLVASAVLLWPDRSERVLGILVGLALAVQVVTTVRQVWRDQGARRFRTMLSIGVLAGLAVALVRHPITALTSGTRVLGVVLLWLALLSVYDSVANRAPRAWSILRGVALGMAGALLVAFPDRVVVVVLSLAAVVVAAWALIDIFAVDGDDDGPRGVGDRVLGWLRQRPDMAEDRVDLMAKVYFEGEEASVRFARFLALMAFAAIIASVGVVVESTAVVIGAMLIAPLMTPLMATALAVPFGWPRRLRRSVGIALSGIVLAIALGALAGALVPRGVDPTSNAEVLARISPTVVDLAIAVAAGAAGAYALSRRDVSDSLPGVAVAIALVPPLTVVGLCWQQGAWAAGNGALLLFLTNAIAILLAGGLMFVLVGVAPIERISASQQRVQTVLFGLASIGIVIVLLLALNGQRLAAADLARASVEDVLGEWSDEHENYRVLEVRTLTDGTIAIDLAGPGQPPGIDALVTDLREQVGEDASIQLSWTPQQQRVFEGS